MTGFRFGLFFAALLLNGAAIEAQATDRIVSLDMCADQYALGLLPLQTIAALSQRAVHEDSYYRQRAGNITRHRPGLEAVLALKPKAVLRTWGGDARLVEGLKKRGIQIIQIEDATDFSAARAELLRVGGLLGQSDEAVAEARRMDAAVAAISFKGQGRKILYYTPSGYTAGSKTWVGEILKRMDYKVMASQDYYSYLSPEVFLRSNPDIYALGFYEDKYAMRRVAGRHPLVRRKIAGKDTIVLPGAAIACNAWYSPIAVSESLN